MPAPAIPDLQVSVAPSGGAASKRLGEPVSLQDIDDFGISAPEVELALDLPDDDPLSAAHPSRALTGTQPDSRGGDASRPPMSQTGDALSGAASASGDEGPVPSAEQPAPAPGQSAWDSMLETSERLRDLAREMWSDDASLGMRIAPGLALAVLAMLITVFDILYVTVTDEVLTIGPVRASWIAGPLLLAGIGLVLYRVFLSNR